MGILKQTHSAKKCKRGTIWTFSTSILSQNIKRIEEGPFGDFKVSKKVSQVRKKIERGRFYKCTKKFLAEAGTRTRNRCKPDIVCTKKRYIQGELCGLTKRKERKLATVIVEHYS